VSALLKWHPPRKITKNHIIPFSTSEDKVMEMNLNTTQFNQVMHVIRYLA